MTNPPPSAEPIPGALQPAADFHVSPERPGWMSMASSFLARNVEAVLVVVLILSLLFINYFIVHKFAFLLFYFLPVLLVGFFLSARQAVLTAVLITGFVAYASLMRPVAADTPDAGITFWNLLIWASFLILTGAIVGKLQEKNRFQMKQVREAYIGIIKILTKYLEAADEYTKSHSERVAGVSSILAQRLGLSTEAVQNVWTAALLHDIGKIEVIELINKASSLDESEQELVDKHTQLGAEILMTTGSILQDAIPVVLEHHRRYDDGGDAIPIGARIVAVADAYDAILTDRPYRAGRPHWEAVERLREGAGSQFDPKVVAALEAEGDQVQALYR
jgi:putative nucleotidyltransferase with HDIG domain